MSDNDIRFSPPDSTMHCGRCNHENSPGQKFCGECGAPLGASAADPLSPQQYTPRHLAERILTSRAALEGERKLVSVLFCDIAQSTELAGRIGADAMHRLLSRFFELTLAEVHSVEGTVNQFLGDGFMALFGAPLAHEDHAQRALLAALAIRQCIRDSEDATLAQLRLRIGVNTGLVVVGTIGDNLRMDYTAVGDTTHLAARLQAGATPDTIRVSAATQRVAGAFFEFKSLGAPVLKGMAGPLDVYELVKARPTSDAVAQGASGLISSPLVGRVAELSALTASLRALREGRGGVVIVTGEPGVGKSRLLAEAHRSSDAAGIRWLEGRSLSFGRHLSYWPFIEILKQCFGIDETDNEAIAWEKLDQGVRELFGEEAGEIAPYLGTVLALKMTEAHAPRVRYLDSFALGKQVLLSMRQLFERLARRQPLVVVMGDWHWVDHTSVALCEHLLPLAGSGALSFWFAARPEPGEPTARIRTRANTSDRPLSVLEIALAPLAIEHSTALLDHLIGIDHLSLALRDQILRKTEGNPFFMEEIVRALIAEGALAPDAQGRSWRLTKPLEDLRLPDTVQGVIGARIDRLAEDVKSVLKLASVIGRSFFVRILRAISETDGPLEANLEHLQHAELIRLRQQIPELEYIFKHALVQEAAYVSIVAERRKAIHRAVAEAIEKLFDQRTQEFTSLLAYHYARAEDWQKAQEYLFKAGDQAGRMAADAEALEHYRLAESAYIKAGGHGLTARSRATLDRKIAQALYGIGRVDQGFDHYYRALSHLGVSYPRTVWGVRRATMRLLGGHLLRKILPRQRASSPSDEERKNARELSIICQYLAWADFFLDEERMLLDSMFSLRAGELYDEPHALVPGLPGLGLVFTLMGANKFARRCMLDGLGHARASRNAGALGLSLFLYGWLQCNERDWDAALETLERAAATYLNAGDILGWGGPTAFQCYFRRQRGELKQVDALASELARLGTDADIPHLACWGDWAHGHLRMVSGPLGLAVAHLTHAMDVAMKTTPVRGAVLVGGSLGQCLLFQGKLDAASDILLAANRTIREKNLRGFHLTAAINGLAALRIAEAERQVAADRPWALRLAKGACRIALRRARTEPSALPEALRLQGTLAWLRGDPREARSLWQASLAESAHPAFALEHARTQLEIGSRLGDAELVDRSAAVLGSMGAHVLVAFALHARAAIAMNSESDRAVVTQRFDQAIEALQAVGAEHQLAAARAQHVCL